MSDAQSKKAKARISPLLTQRQHQLLSLMAEDTGDPLDNELVGDQGEWWVGLQRTNTATVYRLLRLCLISGPERSGGTAVYTLNEEGREILKNPAYQPLILAHLVDKISPL